jgi:hypothetical protein
MADTVSSKVLSNTPRRYVIQIMNLSDGTGETNVVKVDKSTLTGPNGLEPTHFMLDRIQGDTAGMGVTISVDATTDVVLARLGGVGRVNIDYRAQGGLSTKATGDTGDILVSTVGHSSGDSYNLVLHFTKMD